MRVPKTIVVTNPWQQLREFTAARIALGRTGVSQPTQPQLAFQLAHAQARDAVHLALDVPRLVQDLESAALARSRDCLVLDSAAGDRLGYLQNPDLGRRLDEASRARLADRTQSAARHYDMSVVLADGLSAQAIAQHAVPFLRALDRLIAAEKWSQAPLAIVRQGRVAIGDEVAELLGARLVLLLIGERPGLSSPDSMGLYLTWMPRVGLRDDSRNCISNIRLAGLPYEEAALKAHYLLSEMQRRQLSGVRLKEESSGGPALPHASGNNFLLGGPA
ncbi:ethanolamine ammonia-lyase subunit EutC [Polaromonas sp.]|uniref:ethanolamine ammonia-lyase subunit EutC n=1 Tax=Polaromonas sp. TaxID=1869339 RepID=UPI003263CF09